MTSSGDAAAAAADASSRVLVFAPIGRDADLTREFLRRSSMACTVCTSMADLCDEFTQAGAGALLLTEEALDDPAFPRLSALLDAQPAWSELPVLLLAGSPGSDVTRRTIVAMESLRNVTMFERPIRLATVLSALRAALRGRTRQYEVRDLLTQLRGARAAAEAANRLKDEFLAMLSHELRTPLNAIVGWTSLLTRGVVEPHRLPYVYATLERNARVQTQLIADVLDVSRITSGKLELRLEALDLGDLVAQAVETVRTAAAAKGLQLTVTPAPRCVVQGDAERLQQVVWNLLSNAIKFTPAGGTVAVAVDRRGERAVLTVSDTGEGIPPAFLPFVFDRFRQADQSSTRVHGGLGLGLAIVQQLVDLHGGAVTATSDGPGRGAVFRVSLPVAERQADAATPSRALPAASLAGRTVLVVDDDASTREYVAATLERGGARVVVAGSAAEGWTRLHDGAPDVLIADLAMPVEDGLSLMRRIRHEGGNADGVPSIALSAFADARAQEAARAAGFTAFLAKPARPEALLGLVARLLHVPGEAVLNPLASS